MSVGRGYSCKGIFIVYVFVISFVNFPVFADETGEVHQHQLSEQNKELTHEQNVETMLELMGVPAQVNLTASEVLKLYTAKVDIGNTDANIKMMVDAYQQDATQIIYSVLGWPSMKTTYISSYAKMMNEEDVAKVAGFLLSPGGQKFIASQASAGIEIGKITKHLMEADMAEPLLNLGKQLREGLDQLKYQKSQTK